MQLPWALGACCTAFILALSHRRRECLPLLRWVGPHGFLSVVFMSTFSGSFWETLLERQKATMALFLHLWWASCLLGPSVWSFGGLACNVAVEDGLGSPPSGPQVMNSKPRGFWGTFLGILQIFLSGILHVVPFRVLAVAPFRVQTVAPCRVLAMALYSGCRLWLHSGCCYGSPQGAGSSDWRVLFLSSRNVRDKFSILFSPSR